MVKVKPLESIQEGNSEGVLDVDYYVKKAKDLVNDGDVEAALDCFDEAIKSNPDALEIYMEKADFCFDLGENEKALECYDMVYDKLIGLD